MIDIDVPTLFFSLFITFAGGMFAGFGLEGHLMKGLLRKSCERLGYKYEQLEAMMKEVGQE